MKTSATNDALLTYGISSEPNPIQVSPGVATMYVVVSNTTTEPIWCDRIEIDYPVGTLAQSLTNDPGTIDVIVSPATWKLASKTDGQITFVPTDPAHAEITKDGLLFELAGIAVNDQVGSFTLTVYEHSHTGTDPYTLRTNTYVVSKFPYGWYLRDFAAESPSVADGAPAVLTWSASQQGTLEIYYGATGPVDVTAGPPFTSAPLSSDTTFILRASLQIGGETVEHSLTTTVTVTDPAVVAGTLQVLGSATLQSGLSVTGDETVSGTVTAQTLQGTTGSIAGPLGVGGPATLSSATVTGAFGVDGVTSLAGPPVTVPLGQWIPTATDGFLVGYVAQGGSDSTVHSVAWLTLYSGGLTAQVTGGNAGQPDGGSASNPNSGMLPVAAGSQYGATVQMGQYNGVDPAVNVWFVPLGLQSSGQATTEAVATPIEVDATHPAPVSTPGTVAEGVIDLVEELTGRELTAEQRARFRAGS